MKVASRGLRLPIFFSVLLLVWGADPERALAKDLITVFDVRKSLPMDPSEPAYYDYYISAGPEAGLRKGQYLNVVRELPVHDPVQNKAQANLRITVAKIHVIHVEKNISVARLVDELSNDERPTLEFESIMIGDRVDLESVSLEAPKQKRKTSRGPSSSGEGDRGPRAEKSADRAPERPQEKPDAKPEPAPASPEPVKEAAAAKPEPPKAAPEPLPSAGEKATAPVTPPGMVQVPVPPSGDQAGTGVAQAPTRL